MKLDSQALEAKRKKAIELIRTGENLMVALSGGVDSAVLLALSLEALGSEKVVAVTGRSASLAATDMDDARRLAVSLGARHEILDTGELDLPLYKQNSGDRCFHCRTELFKVLERYAQRIGFSRIAYGAISEDTCDYRPGMAAAEQQGILAPLLEAGIGKDDVRALAEQAGLKVAQKPAGACLSSRIPIGAEITTKRLAQVEQAEQVLHERGFDQFRVRHHGEIARLELDAAGNRRIADPGLRRDLAEAIRAVGFRFVALDLEDYRTGSLNPEEGPSTGSTGPTRERGQ